MKISALLVILCSLLCLAPASMADSFERVKEDFVVGKVHSITSTKVNKNLLASTGMVSRGQELEIEILEGPPAGAA